MWCCRLHPSHGHRQRPDKQVHPVCFGPVQASWCGKWPRGRWASCRFHPRCELWPKRWTGGSSLDRRLRWPTLTAQMQRARYDIMRTCFVICEGFSLQVYAFIDILNIACAVWVQGHVGPRSREISLYYWSAWSKARGLIADQLDQIRVKIIVASLTAHKTINYSQAAWVGVKNSGQYRWTSTSTEIGGQMYKLI